jgi:hypothetical protein
MHVKAVARNSSGTSPTPPSLTPALNHLTPSSLRVTLWQQQPGLVGEKTYVARWFVHQACAQEVTYEHGTGWFVRWVKRMHCQQQWTSLVMLTHALCLRGADDALATSMTLFQSSCMSKNQQKQQWHLPHTTIPTLP